MSATGQATWWWWWKPNLHSHTHKYSKHHSGDGAANEAFPRFLGWQLDERRPTEEEAKHVRHDVVTDDHRHWNQEPTQTQATYVMYFINDPVVVLVPTVNTFNVCIHGSQQPLNSTRLYYRKCVATSMLKIRTSVNLTQNAAFAKYYSIRSSTLRTYSTTLRNVFYYFEILWNNTKLHYYKHACCTHMTWIQKAGKFIIKIK